MRFNLTPMGYDVTRPEGDIVEWNISIYDCDWFWPFQNSISSNRTWWQSPWGNDDVVRRSPRLRQAQRDSLHPAARRRPGSPDPERRERGERRSSTAGSTIRSGRASVDSTSATATTRCARPTRGSARIAPGSTSRPSTAARPPCSIRATPRSRCSSRATRCTWASTCGTRWSSTTRTRIAGTASSSASTTSSSGAPTTSCWGGGSRSRSIRTGRRWRTTTWPPSCRAEEPRSPSISSPVRPSTRSAISPDVGYQAEMAVDLTKLGYPADLGDGTLFLGVDLLDGDSFDPAERQLWNEDLVVPRARGLLLSRLGLSGPVPAGRGRVRAAGEAAARR